jgi:hypothetical protein
MRYLQGSFTLPAGSSKITQDQWDAAFKEEKPKKKRKAKIPAKKDEDGECCGCEGCGVDCGCLCS